MARAKKNPRRQEERYVSLRERKRRRRSDFFISILSLVCFGLIAFNLFGGRFALRGLTLTDLSTETLDFRTVDPLRRWHGEDMKIAYLTFNSGPSANVGQILDVLAAEGVQATFFLQGDTINANPQSQAAIRRIKEEGHALGLQSMTHHSYLLYRQDGAPQAFMDEMFEVQQLIYDAAAYRPYLVRPPFGTPGNVSEEHVRLLAEAGMRVWDWHVDTGDWRAGITTEQMVGNVESGLARWGSPLDVIILFHEREITIEALPAVISYLRGQGYRFGIDNPQQPLRMNLINSPDI